METPRPEPSAIRTVIDAHLGTLALGHATADEPSEVADLAIDRARTAVTVVLAARAARPEQLPPA